MVFAEPQSLERNMNPFPRKEQHEPHGSIAGKKQQPTYRMEKLKLNPAMVLE